jgi:hypothetical protein
MSSSSAEGTLQLSEKTGALFRGTLVIGGNAIFSNSPGAGVNTMPESLSGLTLELLALNPVITGNPVDPGLGVRIGVHG